MKRLREFFKTPLRKKYKKLIDKNIHLENILSIKEQEIIDYYIKYEKLQEEFSKYKNNIKNQFTKLIIEDARDNFIETILKEILDKVSINFLEDLEFSGETVLDINIPSLRIRKIISKLSKEIYIPSENIDEAQYIKQKIINLKFFNNNSLTK